MSTHVRELLETLDRAFPFAWAEPWDMVGLAAGDADAPVDGVFVTLDPSVAAIAACVESGANVLLTHHPAYLTPPACLAGGYGPGGLVHAALTAGVSLVACHTNLDRAPAGAGTLAALLGLEQGVPLERGMQELDLVTVFVPPESHAVVIRAMTAAGAGRIGEYSECSFGAAGIGRFTPPHSGGADQPPSQEPVQVAEERVEMVCSRGVGVRVAEAARVAHPYAEPLIVVSEVSITRGAARLGRVCDPDRQITLAGLAESCASTFAVRPRVWGDPSRAVSRIATATGSAGSLLGDVMDSGADALIAGEVRYHDALTAAASGLAIIELGHDVSEWPLVPVLAQAVRAAHPGIPVEVQTPQTLWWTP